MSSDPEIELVGSDGEPIGDSSDPPSSDEEDELGDGPSSDDEGDEGDEEEEDEGDEGGEEEGEAPLRDPSSGDEEDEGGEEDALPRQASRHQRSDMGVTVAGVSADELAPFSALKVFSAKYTEQEDPAKAAKSHAVIVAAEDFDTASAAVQNFISRKEGVTELVAVSTTSFKDCIVMVPASRRGRATPSRPAHSHTPAPSHTSGKGKTSSKSRARKKKASLSRGHGSSKKRR